LAWAPYSKEFPNIVVAGPVPGSQFINMVVPILAPNPETDSNIHYGKLDSTTGGNRGRGQVYPAGNLSNNNEFKAPHAGEITAIEGAGIGTKKVTVTKEDGTAKTVEVLPGATMIVSVGDKVVKDQPLTTNPNVGGFGQQDHDLVLQDGNRVYAYLAVAFSLFISQLSFVLKKKQFEKVQLAEGF